MSNDSDLIYSKLEFPHPPLDRPYTYIDMVTTIDGKILSGNRHESVLDLGSKTDHMLVRRIESASDAVMVGAETVRASPHSWNPGPDIRIVVSRSGDLPFESSFFGGKSYIATSLSSKLAVPPAIGLLIAGIDQVDFSDLMKKIKSLGVNRLLVLGGSRLNGELLRASLVDELFLTIAAKVKLGDDVPTYAGGEAFSRSSLPSFSLVEHHVVADEIFLRYRWKREHWRS